MAGVKRWGSSIFCGIGLGVACVLTVSFFAFGGWLLDGLERGRLRFVETLKGRLLARHQVVFLVDFDEVCPEDRVSGLPLLFWNLDRVPGKFGQARRIDLGQGSVLRWPNSPFGFIGNDATFAAWYRPGDICRRQVLWKEKGFSLELADGELRLTLGEAENPLRVTCPYAGELGEFCHVALVFERSHVAIYQQGAETARLMLEQPIEVSSLLFALGVEAHRPFEGDLDELCIWQRALTAKEVESIATSKRGLRWKYEPMVSALETFFARAESLAAGIYRTAGRLVPPRLDPVPGGREFPKVTMWPSKKDERHFTKAHEASLYSGYRTPKAANFRGLDVTVDGRTARMEVSLDDVYGRTDGRRPAFMVKDPTGGGCGLIRLYPPELHAALHPDAPYPLPLSGHFVRLFSGDSYRGLYVMEEFERTKSAWMARGERNTGFKRALYYLSVPSDADVPPPGMTEENAYEKTVSLVLSDMLFPWSRQELRTRLHRHKQRWARGKFDPVPKADELLQRVTAGNPSPLFVTNDLALDVPGITWETSDATLITRDGRVNRPATGAPRPVTLTPEKADGTRGKPLRFRVVPMAPDLQTLFLYIGVPVQKHRKSDFACFRVPAGGGEPEWLFGTGAEQGGIKHRGNTSYARGAKRPFMLCFDHDVNWSGTRSRASRRVLLLAGYSDATRLRNKVSFDSFRTAATADVPNGIVDVTWAEVFINGEYFGVWETCRRVKDVCESGTKLFKVQALNQNLWGVINSDMTDCVSVDNCREDPYQELERLFEFTSTASKEQFAEEVEKTFHVNSLIDYILMLNFTENFDGRMTNHYIGKWGGKWFIVPWDYDKTFGDGKTAFLKNRLIARLYNDVPGFPARVEEKWRDLREGAMSDTAVLGRIDRDAAMLAPYMEEEYRLLSPVVDMDAVFPVMVERLKGVVAERLALMDRRFGGATEE